MKTFDFLFDTKLSKTLQKVNISAAEGQKVGEMVADTRCTLCPDKMYDLFWDKVSRSAYQ